MIKVDVRVHPGSSHPHVGGSYDGALVVRVRARAVDGAATDEVLSALAVAFGVHARSVSCVHGTHSRNKVIAVRGDDDVLERRRRELLDDVGDARPTLG